MRTHVPANATEDRHRLIDRIDLLVEFSTLGEYALADDLRPVAMHADTPAPSGRRSRDDCPWRERAAQPVAATAQLVS